MEEAQFDPNQDNCPNLRVLGDFRLMKELGKGGAGTVWEAEQLSLGRRVAVKLLSSTSPSQKERTAFQREAQAGGRLQHPSIVQVFAVGEAEGIPYLAQELVEGGQTLLHWLARARKASALTEGYGKACARLLLPIAEALAVAHQAGVVHRDIKAANILLTPEAVPKIADFGLASIADGLPDHLAPGVGSPYTMSPEQVAAGSLRVGASTDIFSLGATLYEMLTLRRAFDGDTLAQVMEKILLLDPPSPSSVRSKISKDLSAICLKSLEKSPANRYLSMQDFADDLSAFLRGETVQAKPPSPLARASRWMRRHPVQSASMAGCLFATVLIGGLAWKNVSSRAEKEAVEKHAWLAKEEALLEADASMQALHFLVDVFQTADASTSARSLLEVGVEKANVSFRDQAPMKARVFGTLGRVYRSVGDYSAAEPLLARAMTPQSFEWALEKVRLSILQGAYAGAEKELLAAMDFLDAESDQALEAKGLLGYIRWRKGEDGQGNVLAELLREQRTRFGEEDDRTLDTQNGLFAILFRQNRLTEAEPLILFEVQIRSRKHSPLHPETLTSLHDLASVYTKLGRYEEAEQKFREVLEGRRRVLPTGHPDTLSTMANMAVLFSRQKNYDQAEPFAREALVLRKQVLPALHPNTLIAAGNLANILRKKGLLSESERYYEEALLGFFARGEGGSSVPNALRPGYVLLLIAQEKWEKAEKECRMALESLSMESATRERLERLLEQVLGNQSKLLFD